MTFYRTALAALLLAVVATGAAAQVDQRISGTVRDQSNAFVDKAKVTVTNERTGESRETTTNDKGYFVIGSLKASSYTIKVEFTGFNAITYDQLPLAVGQE